MPYVIVRTSNGVKCVVWRNGDCYTLPHIVKHSPTGFEFGYAGSGPADLALSILTDYMGDRDRAELRYQSFKNDFVACQHNESFVISDMRIRMWLDAKRML